MKFHQNLSTNQWKEFKKTNFAKFTRKCEKFDDVFLKYWGLSGAKAWKSCRSRQELSNGYLLAKIDVDTAENESSEILKCGCRPTRDRGPRKPLQGDNQIVEAVELNSFCLFVVVFCCCRIELKNWTPPKRQIAINCQNAVRILSIGNGRRKLECPNKWNQSKTRETTERPA